MLFIIIVTSLFAIRASVKKVLPWKILSCSTINLIGVIVFIGLGMQYDEYYSPILKGSLTIVFYLFILAGEFIANRIKIINTARLKVAGDYILRKFIPKIVPIIVFFLVTGAVIGKAFFTYKSIPEAINQNWLIDTRIERSIGLLERDIAYSGSNAIINTLKTQLWGLWLLGFGIAYFYFPRFTFFYSFIYAISLLATTSGSRSSFVIAFIFPFLAYFLTTKHKKSAAVVFVLAMILLLIVLDLSLLGRQDKVASGNLTERIGRVLRVDFAYGGSALQLGGRESTTNSSISYLKLFAGIVIPRFFWSGKPVTNPNQEMTEFYYGKDFAEIGNIRLFTPLGEGLFYFGYLGFGLIGFLYGLTGIWLERIYITSKCYLGLLIHLYIWQFLGMRHTYFNLFLSVVLSKILILILLILLARIISKKMRMRQNLRIRKI